MSVSIHVTDPTPAECTALIAYLQSVAGIVVTERTEVRVGELSHSVTNVVNHHTTPAEDMKALASVSGESKSTHFMDEPIVAIPSFMDAPVSVVHGAPLPPVELTHIAIVEDTSAGVIVDTAAIFGGVAPVPPVVAPAAPVMQVPLAHAATSGAELDIFNLPWDGRIHAATKAKLQDGSWRQRRGVDPALVVTVESELRGIMGVPAPIVHAAPPAPIVHAAPVVHAAPPAPDAPVVPAAANPFAAFMAFMTPLIVGKIITTPQLGSICVSLGLPHAGALAQRHDLIPAVQARVQAILDGGAA